MNHYDGTNKYELWVEDPVEKIADIAIDPSDWPEVVFGLVGPIGVNMAIVEQKLKEALVAVGYNPQAIRLTDLMPQIAVDGVDAAEPLDPAERYENRIAYANAVRRKCENDAALAALAVAEIRNIRVRYWKRVEGNAPTESATDQQGHDEEVSEKEIEKHANRPIARNAYILRQLKREEEILFLRKIYGRKFIQISIHASEIQRTKNLERNFGTRNAELTPESCRKAAEELVQKDMHERSDAHGQRIDEVFHLGDAFINGRNEESISDTIDRFVDAFFW